MEKIEFCGLNSSGGLKIEILQFLKTGYGWFNVAILILLSLVNMVVTGIIFPDWHLANDTSTYFDTWNLYLEGSLEGIRTPLYPIFIGPFQSVTYGWWINLLLQKIIGIIAYFYLWRLMGLLSIPDKYRFWCLVYLLLMPIPYMIDWDGFLLTESLSRSLMVFFVWNTVRFIMSPDLRPAILSSLFLFLLIMLRPGNIYLLLMVVVMYAVMMFWRGYARKTVYGLLAVIVSGGIIYGYKYITDQATGNGPLTYVSVVNNLNMIVCAEVDNPDYYKEPEMRSAYAFCRQKLDSLRNSGKEITSWTYYEEVKKIDPFLIETRDFIKTAIRENEDKIEERIRTHFRLMNGSDLISIRRVSPFRIHVTRIQVKIQTAWVILVTFLIFGISKICRKERIGWVCIWLSGIALGMYIVSGLGAYSDWSRLTWPVVPIVCLAGTKLLAEAWSFVQAKWRWMARAIIRR